MSNLHLWLRDEHRGTEQRTPLLPAGAKELLAQGAQVTVERSTKRIVRDDEFAGVGCQLVAPGTWTNAPAGAIILGLKELPEAPSTLKHRHIYFAHAFKGQSGWKELLGRFDAGGGHLWDLEYLADDNGRRVAMFGYWAGYMGAALAMLHWLDKAAGRQSSLHAGLTPFANAAALDDTLTSATAAGETMTRAPKVLVLGALGRSGRGACEILGRHGAEITKWDKDETNPIDRAALAKHDILINCALILEAIPPFLRREDIRKELDLTVVTDVSCDPSSDINPLPFYGAPTSWEEPVLTVQGTEKSLDLIAIDNLPSLLPAESSAEFAHMLLPHLQRLNTANADPVWRRASEKFKLHLGELTRECA